MNRALLILTALLLTGCPDAAKTPQKTGSQAPRTVEEAQRLHAQKAAKAVGKQLKEALEKAIEKDGAAGGISACKTAAPTLTLFEANRFKVRIGRTSFKLRNPKNVAPAWAKSWVEQKVDTPQFDTATDGTVRALLPIKLQALCTTCHGDAENLSKEVKAALAKDYPDDQATGFAPGDLRGWFWVEVPHPKGVKKG